MITKNKNYSTQ